MKKRFITFALALSIIFSFSTVSAKYYVEDNKGGESAEEIFAYSVDTDKIIADLQNALSLVKDGEDAEKIFAILDENGDFTALSTIQSIAKLKSSIDNSEENNAYLAKIGNDCIEIPDIFNQIITAMSESDKYRDDLLYWSEMTEDELQDYLNGIPSEKMIELSKEENALLEKYHNAISSVPQSEGETDFLQYTKDLANKYVGDIFVKLVEVRTEIAKEEGYDSYADYAYDQIYYKDYGESEREAFYKNTEKYILPLTEKIAAAYNASLLTDYQPDTKTEDEILAQTREYLEQINPELTEAFDYMTEHKLFDIAASDTKEAMSYTIGLEKFGVPFLFINPDVFPLQSTLVHEYGHYNAGFHDQYLKEYTDSDFNDEYKPQNIDVCEIQSQGLEILFYDYYGKIYGNRNKSEKLLSVINMLSSVEQASLMSLWQERVYEEENLTVEKCNKIFKEIAEKYRYANLCDEDGGYYWAYVNHNFEMPMYYISYGVSAMAALDLISMPGKDNSASVDKYMRLSAMGERNGFKETLESCGFDDIFSESTFEKISEMILDAAGIGYEDVTSEDWFFPSVIIANDYIGSDNYEFFSPDNDATRQDFVISLGKLHDDMVGIEEYETPFSDIDDKYISWAAENGIAAGLDESTFGGDIPLTREQVLCFIFRLAGSPKADESIEFTDADEISSWARDAVAWAEDAGIVSGYEDKTLKPKDNVTRAEAATFVAMLHTSYYR